MVVVVAPRHAAGIYRVAADPVTGIGVTDSVANSSKTAAVSERRIAGRNIRPDQRISISFPGAIASYRRLCRRVCPGEGACMEDSTATVGDRHADRNYCGGRGS